MRSLNRTQSFLIAVVVLMLTCSSSLLCAQDSTDQPETSQVVAEQTDAEPTVAESPGSETEGDQDAPKEEVAPDPPAEAEEADSEEADGIQGRINDVFGKVNGALASVMFYPVAGVVPLAVLWLVMGSIFFFMSIKDRAKRFGPKRGRKIRG